MPTLIVIDASAKLDEPVTHGDASLKKKDVVQRGILKLLRFLESNHTTETVCLSDNKEIILPFTNDYKALRKGLFAATINKNASLGAPNGLSSVLERSEQLISEYGDPANTQVIFVSASAGGQMPDITAQLNSALSHRTKYHALVVSSDPQVWSEPSEIEPTQHALHYLARRSGGLYQVVSAAESATSFKQAIDALLATHYRCYVGAIHCGHMSSCEISLAPSPHLYWTFDVLGPQTTAQTYEIPRTLSIVGFVKVEHVSSPPLLSQHVIYPRGNSLLPTVGQAHPAPERDLFLSLRSHLRQSSLAAVILLKECSSAVPHFISCDTRRVTQGPWFGFINTTRSTTFLANKFPSNACSPDMLVLSTLIPGATPPWLDYLKEVTHEVGSDVSTRIQSVSIPETSSRLPSANALPYGAVDSTNLQKSMAKVIKHLCNLPKKMDSLVQECASLQRHIDLYSLTSLRVWIKSVATTLSAKSGDGAPSHTTQQVLSTLIDIVDNEKSLADLREEVEARQQDRPSGKHQRSKSPPQPTGADTADDAKEPSAKKQKTAAT